MPPELLVSLPLTLKAMKDVAAWLRLREMCEATERPPDARTSRLQAVPRVPDTVACMTDQLFFKASARAAGMRLSVADLAQTETRRMKERTSRGKVPVQAGSFGFNP